MTYSLQVVEVLPVPPLYEANLGRSLGPILSSVQTGHPGSSGDSGSQKEDGQVDELLLHSWRQSSECRDRLLQTTSSNSETKRASELSLTKSMASTNKLLSDVRNMEERLKHMRGI
jgi:hypothetical protein